MKVKFSLLFFLICSAVMAQRTANIGFSGGVTHYCGDLANEEVFPFSSASPGMAITIRDFLNNPMKSGTRYSNFDMQLRFSWHRLQYDETTPIGDMKGTDLRNYRRGLNFRNDLIGTEVDFTYNIYPNLFSPLHKQKYSIFFQAGIGVFYGQPKADLFRGNQSIENRYFAWNDGTLRDQAENAQGIGNVVERDGEYETDLRNWNTEGQGYSQESHSTSPYSNFNIGIPLGGGFRYFYNKELTFSAEFNYYYFFTDYLDDVSTRYATNEELKAANADPVNYQLAKYISDPSGQGTTGFVESSSKRGNPKQKDSFSYISLEVSYKIAWKKKGVYGQ